MNLHLIALLSGQVGVANLCYHSSTEIAYRATSMLAKIFYATYFCLASLQTRSKCLAGEGEVRQSKIPFKVLLYEDLLGLITSGHVACQTR